jgi:hypothetical protein
MVNPVPVLVFSRLRRKELDMNRNMAATEIRDAGKCCAGNICWSSEWSFVEDADAASQKPARPPISKKQPTGSHTDASPGSS